MRIEWNGMKSNKSNQIQCEKMDRRRIAVPLVWSIQFQCDAMQCIPRESRFASNPRVSFRAAHKTKPNFQTNQTKSNHGDARKIRSGGVGGCVCCGCCLFSSSLACCFPAARLGPSLWLLSPCSLGSSGDGIEGNRTEKTTQGDKKRRHATQHNGAVAQERVTEPRTQNAPSVCLFANGTDNGGWRIFFCELDLDLDSHTPVF